MLALTIILGVACAVLLVLLSIQDNKNTKLAVENSLVKGRMEGLMEKLSRQAPEADEPLTQEAIAEAVRRSGYAPEVSGTLVSFMLQGERFIVDTERLPQVFVVKQFQVDANQWDTNTLRHAAHVMSDDLIMVKAIIDEDGEGDNNPVLRFLVAALDRNYASFKENLTTYVRLIEDGRQQMHEVYERMVQEKRDAALTVDPFLSARQKDNKTMS